MMYLKSYVESLTLFMSRSYSSMIIAIAAAMVIAGGSRLVFISADESVMVKDGIIYKKHYGGLLSGWVAALSMLNLMVVALCAVVACTRRVKNDYT
ncbi:MAG: hypothetical protein J5966_11245, partial [Lachnospiraceae bacterium]|nr:hypothetical protein [Lachnospiraceae bacterium]